MPKPPRAPGDGSAPPAAALYVLVGLFFGVPVLAAALEWFGFPWRSFLPYGDSDNWIIAAIASPLVIAPLVILLAKLWQARRAARWSQTSGRIVKSAIEARHHQFAGEATTVRNVAAVEYDFDVAGRTYRGTRVGVADDPDDIEGTLGRYPLGKAVTVYYDPADPNRCLLEREVPKGLASGCLLMLVGLAVAVVVFYFAVTNATRLLAGIVPDKGNAPAAVFAACFGLALVWFFFGYRHYLNAAATWPSVPGKVETSAVESYIKREDGHEETEFSPVVEYSYEVHGLKYRSRQVKLGMQIGGSQSVAETMAKKYPQGSDVTVHYDPENPSNAALERPTGSAWLLLAAAVVCFAIAVYVSAIFR